MRWTKHCVEETRITYNFGDVGEDRIILLKSNLKEMAFDNYWIQLS